MSRIIIFVIFFLSLFTSCSHEVVELIAPSSIVNRAADISEKYLGMRYEWGGQSFWYEEDGAVDCSGLIVNAYKEACSSTGYALLFYDASSQYLYSEFTQPVASPIRGDLIFMGENGVVSHVAIFRKFIGDDIEFLDAYSIEGRVMIRTYTKDNEKIISFGRMLLAK